MTDLIASLIARAAELSEDGLRTAVAEFNRLLEPMPDAGLGGVPGELDVAFNAVLFSGLTFKHRMDIEAGMEVLPFEQIRRFVDPNLVNERAPPGAGFHCWRIDGGCGKTVPLATQVSPERRFWGSGTEESRKVFSGSGDLSGSSSHTAGDTCAKLFSTMANCIDRSAGRTHGSGGSK